MGSKSSSSQAQNTTTTTNINDERVAVDNGGISATRGSNVTITNADKNALETANIATVVAGTVAIEKAKEAAKLEKQRIAAQQKQASDLINFAAENSGDGFDLANDVASLSFRQVDQSFDFVRNAFSDSLAVVQSTQESALEGAGEFANRFVDQIQESRATENERNFDRITSVVLVLAVIGGAVYVIRG